MFISVLYVEDLAWEKDKSAFRYLPKNPYQETTWRRAIKYRLAIFGTANELCICVVNKNNSQGEMEETTCQYQSSERIANNPFLKIAMASDPKASIASKIFPIFPFKTFYK